MSMCLGSGRVARSCVFVAACCGLGAGADTATLAPIKDNTLIETPGGSLSNGMGDGIYCGRTGAFDGGTLRRAVMAFDVAGGIPAGSTVTSATLTLTVELAAPGSTSEVCRLYRLLADWGEGTSSGAGAGGPSTTDDATWIHTFYPGDTWTNPGGDFTALVSATTSVGKSGADTWGSTAAMVADVQGWLDDPGTNFGWVLTGNELEPQTARKFVSREGLIEADRPVLSVGYDPPPDCPWDCVNGDGEIGIDEFLAVLGTWGEVGVPCDFDGDGVGINDFLKVLGLWGPCP